MTPKIITISSKVQDHQHAIRKGSITKQFLNKYLRVGFNYKKIQETTLIHLEQHTKSQTLIQMTNYSKDTQKFQKIQIR